MDSGYAPGTRVGHRYQIVGRLGAGGMGEVFLASDRLTGSCVALKCVRSLRTVQQPVSERTASSTSPTDSRLVDTGVGPERGAPDPGVETGLAVTLDSLRDPASLHTGSSGSQRVVVRSSGREPGAHSGSRDPSLIEQYLTLSREFATLASLRHPHIVSVYDYGFDAERPYFTMEYLPQSRDVCRAAAAEPLAVRIELLAQVAQALSYLHRRGILHRDFCI